MDHRSKAQQVQHQLEATPAANAQDSGRAFCRSTPGVEAAHPPHLVQNGPPKPHTGLLNKKRTGGMRLGSAAAAAGVAAGAGGRGTAAEVLHNTGYLSSDGLGTAKEVIAAAATGSPVAVSPGHVRICIHECTVGAVVAYSASSTRYGPPGLCAETDADTERPPSELRGSNMMVCTVWREFQADGPDMNKIMQLLP